MTLAETLRAEIERRLAICDAATDAPWELKVVRWSKHNNASRAPNSLASIGIEHRVDKASSIIVLDHARVDDIQDAINEGDSAWMRELEHDLNFTCASRNQRPDELNALLALVDELEEQRDAYANMDEVEHADHYTGLLAIIAKHLELKP